jgi:hypothetical protein
MLADDLAGDDPFFACGLAVADHGQRAVELLAAHRAGPAQLAVRGAFGLGFESQAIA